MVIRPQNRFNFVETLYTKIIFLFIFGYFLTYIYKKSLNLRTDLTYLTKKLIINQLINQEMFVAFPSMVNSGQSNIRVTQTSTFLIRFC